MDLRNLIPDKMQTSKELVRQGANAFFLLFMMQAFGLDLEKVGVSPVINDWRVSLALFVFFMGPLTWISNRQESEKRNGTGSGTTEPPPPPAA